MTRFLSPNLVVLWTTSLSTCSITVLAQTTTTNSDASFEPCEVCVGGVDSLDANALIGPTSCHEWLQTVQGTSLAEDESCMIHRSQGVKFCGCGGSEKATEDILDTTESEFELNTENNDYDTCYLCGDADSNLQATNPTRVIPDSLVPGVTCADLLEMPMVDHETCPLFQEKYQRWCGCPNAPTEVPCPFCEGGGEPNLVLPYPFLADSNSMEISSCATLHDFYQVQTAASCQYTRFLEKDGHFLDMQAYCQCPSRQPPQLCGSQFCPPGQAVPSHKLEHEIELHMGIRCGDASFLLDFIDNVDNCGLLLDHASECCSGVSDLSALSDDVSTADGDESATIGNNNSSDASRVLITKRFAVASIAIISMTIHLTYL